MKGRKPKPTFLHLINGNPGKRQRNRKEPKPKRGIPNPPEHLSDKAKIAWELLAVKLDRMGVLTEADGWALEELAEGYVEVVTLRRRIATEGRTQTVTTKNGDVRKVSSPLVIQHSDAAKRFRALMCEFGLTPSARTRVNAETEESENKDPAAEFFG